ncbi:MAG: TlpA family protein disulfide reductase, partial [Granulosicoccaceae bacterium]
KPSHGPQKVAAALPAPKLSLATYSGAKYSLDSTPGKVMLLSFWATWCPPCVEELPSMNALAADYAKDDFEILSVNFQESKTDIESFLQRVDVDFPILLDLDGIASHDWHVFSFPSSFILDRRGRIRYTLNKAIDWHTPEIKTLLDELIAE